MGRIYEVKATITVTRRVEADSYAEAKLIMEELIEEAYKNDSENANIDYVRFTGEVW